jgi:hypothetical protein
MAPYFLNLGADRKRMSSSDAPIGMLAQKGLQHFVTQILDNKFLTISMFVENIPGKFRSVRKIRLITADSSHESNSLSCLRASRKNLRDSGSIDPLILDLGSPLR